MKMYRTLSWMTLCALVGACEGGTNEDVASGAFDMGVGQGTEDMGGTGSDPSEFQALLEPWRLNDTARTDNFSSASGSEGALYDVQVAEIQTVDSVPYIYVETNGLPQYDIEVTTEIVEALNSRPRAATDFMDGQTTIEVGDVVRFGDDIGYESNLQDCENEGGYWPPGPGCPVALARAEYLAAEPTLNSEACDTGLGTIGLMVNGAAIFNWGDGMAFGDGVWFNLAPIAEQYDVDICGGHAANGEYHHHFYTTCLADLLQDDGMAHSPIYGFAADGFPLYGPFEASGELAVSAWTVRDYGASEAEGGCNSPGQRTCVLVDPYDASQGVDGSVAAGPALGETVRTLSGNELAATNGYYFEDYTLSGAAVVGAQLDENNGHDTGDGRGYHYHITLTEEADALVPAFPFTIGPRFAGTLPDSAVTNCSTGAGGAPGGGPPGGGPPGGGPPGG
ncbi:MAG: YHYH protein [Myxococcota bacterium]